MRSTKRGLAQEGGSIEPTSGSDYDICSRTRHPEKKKKRNGAASFSERGQYVQHIELQGLYSQERSATPTFNHDHHRKHDRLRTT